MSDDTIDPSEIERDAASCVASQQALIDRLEALTGVDPAAPSLLPDWSIGHVLTHIARNADSIISMLDGNDQYPRGREGRNADIEAGAGRTWQKLVDDVSSTAGEVEARLLAVDDWSGTVAMINGGRPKVQVPLLRQREVEVHRVDLGLGDEFSGMPADYVRRDLRLMDMLWRARKPMGMTPLPDAALAVEPPTRLAWMMGRTDIDGLAPADLF